MENTKLIKICRSLSKELNQLKKFIYSPYHNPKASVIKLFEILRKKEFKNLNEQEVYQAVFENKEFDKKNLRHVMNYLVQVIEDFLVIQQLKKNKRQQQLLLVQAAIAHPKAQLFQAVSNKLKKDIQSGGIKDLDIQQLQYELEMMHYVEKRKVERKESVELTKANAFQDIYLIGSKLWQACILLSHENILPESVYDFSLVRELEEYLSLPDNRKLLDHAAISLPYYSYKVLTSKTGRDFEKLKEQLAVNRACFKKDTLRDYYIIIINFCNQNLRKRVSREKEFYKKEAFQMYVQALQEEVLMENEQLSSFHYKNIAILGTGVKAFDWVAQFLEAYRTKLPIGAQETFYNLGWANLYFEKGSYQQAKETLDKLEPLNLHVKEVYQRFTSRILKSKIYYELAGVDDALSDELDYYLISFEVAVRKSDKLNATFKRSFIDFILIVKKLVRYRSFKNKKDQQKLQEAIDKKIDLTERAWLLEKLKN